MDSARETLTDAITTRESVMNRYKVALKKLMKDESGQDLIEYALVASLVGLAAVTALQGVATALTTIFGSISTRLSNPSGT